MKILKKTKFIWVLILVLPFLSACSENNEYDYSAKRVELARAEKISASNTLTFSAELSGAKETLLSAKIPGKIERIEAEIGDSFSSGEVLAYLGGEENFVQRNISGQNYQNSLLLLENTRSQMQQNIKGSEASLLIAKENLSLAKKGELNNTLVSPEKISEAELQIDLSNQEMQRIEDGFKQKREDIYDGIESSITQATILSNKVLHYLYTLNGESLPDTGNNFELANMFVTTSFQVEQAATLVIRNEFKPSFYSLEDFYNSQIKNNDPERDLLIKGAGIAGETLNSAKNALQAMSDVVSYSVSHSGLSQPELSAYASEISQFSTQVESLLLSQDAGVNIGLLGVEQSLQNLKLEEKNQLALAGKNISLAEQKLETLRKSTEASYDDYDSRVAIAEAQVRQAEESLENARRQLDLQVQMSKNQVDANLGLLQMSDVGVNNTRLEMPYDGIVVDKFIDEGTVVNAGTPVLKVADNSFYKLIIYVPESQIKYFALTQVGEAYSVANQEQKYKAVVERISPKSDADTKKIRVELLIDDFDANLKIGQEMKFRVLLREDEKIIAVPSNAVFDFYGDKMLYLFSEGKVYRKPVQIGIVGSSHIQILEGLKEGEDVVVSGMNNLRDGEEVEVIEK